MKREALLDAAIRVLLVNNGASLNEIAVAAGVGRTTLHRYFATREDLLQAISEVALIDAERAIDSSHIEDGPPLDALERVIHALLPICDRFQFLLWFGDTYLQLSEETKIHDITTRLTERFDDLMRRGQDAGVLRKDLPTRWLNDSFTALLLAAADGIRNGWTAPREAPRLIMTTFLSGTKTSAVQH